MPAVERLAADANQLGDAIEWDTRIGGLGDCGDDRFEVRACFVLQPVSFRAKPDQLILDGASGLKILREIGHSQHCSRT